MPPSAWQTTRIIVEIVRRQFGQIGFAVHPQCRMAGRFFAWLGGAIERIAVAEAIVPSKALARLSRILDIGLSAFALFFMGSPSFQAYQHRLEELVRPRSATRASVRQA